MLNRTWIFICVGSAGVVVTTTPPAVSAPVGIVDSWSLTTGVQDYFGEFNQTLQSTNMVQTPYVVHQMAQIGNSTAGTYLNVVIDDHHVVLVVEPDQYCIRETMHQSRCTASGEVIISPTQDVTVAFTGSYTYQLVGDPTSMGASISISKILPSGGQSIIGQGYSRESIFGPLSGTLLFNRSAVLPAGSQYRITYQFISDAADPTLPVGGNVTGSGAFQIDVHPVPEPAALGALSAAVLLLHRRRGNHRTR